MAHCGEMAHLCECTLPAGHEIEHRCRCGGSWRGSYNDDGNTFEIVTEPGTGKPMDNAQAFRKVLAMLGFEDD